MINTCLITPLIIYVITHILSVEQAERKLLATVTIGPYARS